MQDTGIPRYCTVTSSLGVAIVTSLQDIIIVSNIFPNIFKVGVDHPTNYTDLDQ